MSQYKISAQQLAALVGSSACLGPTVPIHEAIQWATTLAEANALIEGGATVEVPQQLIEHYMQQPLPPLEILAALNNYFSWRIFFVNEWYTGEATEVIDWIRNHAISSLPGYYEASCHFRDLDLNA